VPEEKTIQGVRPEIADGLQKVLVFFKGGERQRQSIGYPDGFP
jgi:hypothetical protein